MTRDELAAWLRLTTAPGIGPDAARRLLAAFGLPQQVLAQSHMALQQVVSSRQATALLAASAEAAALTDTTWQWLQEAPAGQQRSVLALGSPDYPASLLQMADPPVLLYALGQVDRLAQHGHGIAMVGSRTPTPQGADNARQFARAFASMGWCVVSGLALGVDGAAHEGALLGAPQGTAADVLAPATIAVVGTGLDRVYPRQHRDLAHRIAANGVILSELPLGAPPLAHHFPQRNRIIAGLSHGVLVVEAALQSGSLITARLASEQGKEVFAIPGSIHSPQARGCHALIRQGAKLVESAQDVFEELRHVGSPLPTSAQTAANAADAANAAEPAAPAIHPVLAVMGHDPVSLDALLARTGMDTATLQTELLTLELDGRVGRLPGGLFQQIGQG